MYIEDGVVPFPLYHGTSGHNLSAFKPDRPPAAWPHKMVEAHAVLEVADGVLDLGVAAAVGLQVQGVAVSIGDEGVIAVRWRTAPVGSRG